MINRFLSFVMIVATTVSVVFIPATFANDARPQVGHEAPDFTFKDLEGSEISLSDFQGRPVFFSPWFTGCPVCQREMVEWQAFYEAFGDLITVLGINVADNPQVAADFMEQRGATFPTLSDPIGQFLLQYRVTKMPTMFFVDPDGVIQEISKVTLTVDGIANIFAEQIFAEPILPLTTLETIESITQGNATGELIDVNGDGRPDGAQLDRDGDGTFEATVALYKGFVRGTVPSEETLEITMRFEAPAAEFIRVDLDGDGNPEIFIEDVGFDGVNRITVDLDSDGVTELALP